ncbi:NirD/YgiW/YdeI family stress tolerance protein [Vibrio sp.]|nr:NirD/YgiW/YdeI family stress tolerance protein [Vibrio sp.]
MTKATISAILLALTTQAAFANTNAQDNAQTGGFQGPSETAAVISVKEALDVSDETVVALEGHIVKSLGDEEYVFQDDSGEIKVEIENWQGLNIKPEDTVRINGEVESEILEDTSIEVTQIALVK